MPQRRPLEARFWEKVFKTDYGCWLWTGSLNTGGYGNISRGGRGGGAVSAHRLSYEMHKGVIPDGALILHHCDEKPCVNPDHLYAGSAQDNVDDIFGR